MPADYTPGFARTFLGPGPVSTAVINVANNGNNAIIAGSAGKRIVLLLADFLCSAPVVTTWESSGGTVIDGPKSWLANAGQILPYTEVGHFATVAGEGLTLNLNGAVQVSGHILFALVAAQ